MEIVQKSGMTLSPDSRRRLGRILFAVFVLALVMGAGPGLYLINPDPADPEARHFVFGIPVIYAWAVLWISVQSGSVLAAWFWLWRTAPEGGLAGKESDLS